MSLTEANRLAHLGSPVLHNRTLQPLFDTDVSLAVRSSYAPHTDFTLIAPKSSQASAPVVTSLGSVSLLQLSANAPLAQLLACFADAGLTPLAHWPLTQNRVELAFTHENEKQALAILESHSSELGLSEISVLQDFGLVALVSADANLYRRGFARLLSREARPLCNDCLLYTSPSPRDS